MPTLPWGRTSAAGSVRVGPAHSGLTAAAPRVCFSRFLWTQWCPAWSVMVLSAAEWRVESGEWRVGEWSVESAVAWVRLGRLLAYADVLHFDRCLGTHPHLTPHPPNTKVCLSKVIP